MKSSTTGGLSALSAESKVSARRGANFTVKHRALNDRARCIPRDL